MDRGKVIGMKEAGMSTREVARATGHDRKSIAKVWKEYQLLSSQLGQPGADTKTLQARMTEEPKYNSAGRTRHKYTPESGGGTSKDPAHGRRAQTETDQQANP